MSPVPAPHAQPLPCFLHTTTEHIFCGPQDLLLRAFEATGHQGELVPLSCNTTVFSDPTRVSVIDPVNDNDKDWEAYLNAKLPMVLQSRSAEPEAEAEAEAEPVDSEHMLARRKKPKVGSGSSITNTSAAGRVVVVVGGLGLWIALGWMITGVVSL